MARGVVLRVDARAGAQPHHPRAPQHPASKDVIDGEFTVKRIAVNDDSLYLVPENDSFSPIKITESMNFQVWGVITHIIHKAR